MSEQEDKPWQERERELRYAESLMRFSAAADRLSQSMDKWREDMHPAAMTERLLRAYPRQGLVVLIVVAGVASIVASIVGSVTALAWGVP